MSSSLTSYRTMEEYQRSVRQAGSRVYHHLTDPQKAELKHMLHEQMSRDHDGQVNWKDVVEKATIDLIRTKNSQGEMIDANSLVDEVLPIAHAAIPGELRQRLFASIFEMTRKPASDARGRTTEDLS